MVKIRKIISLRLRQYIKKFRIIQYIASLLACYIVNKIYNKELIN